MLRTMIPTFQKLKTSSQRVCDLDAVTEMAVGPPLFLNNVKTTGEIMRRNTHHAPST